MPDAPTYRIVLPVRARGGDPPGRVAAAWATVDLTPDTAARLHDICAYADSITPVSGVGLDPIYCDDPVVPVSFYEGLTVGGRDAAWAGVNPDAPIIDPSAAVAGSAPVAPAVGPALVIVPGAGLHWEFREAADGAWGETDTVDTHMLSGALGALSGRRATP